MTDDRVIDIRQYLAQSVNTTFPRVFSVYGGEGGQSRLALPVWRAITLLGGDWGGVVSLSNQSPGVAPVPRFILDLREEPARTESPVEPLHGLVDAEAPALAASKSGGLAVLLGENDDGRWFLRVRGGRSDTPPDGKARETLLFLAGECSGFVFLRKLATPLPSSSSAP